MRNFKNILVTGGSGFIGSNFIRILLNNIEANDSAIKVVNFDKLTYAGKISNNTDYENNKNYEFIQGDICSHEEVTGALKKHDIDLIINFAAESHVDNSISGPEEFIQTNILGTFNLLKCFDSHRKELSSESAFLHVSTDEVYGSLEINESKFTELNSYKPNSPYSASKASSDHLVRAWHKTYKLNTLITNCSNNYGPFQDTEKLIPKVIMNALNMKEIPIYGNGSNIRDWIYVDDHCKGIIKVFRDGAYGKTYNIGGLNEKTNLEIVNQICKVLDEIHPSNESYTNLITFVEDRPGHDFRYSINPDKIMNELGWYPQETFETGIEKTILWYLEVHKK